MCDKERLVSVLRPQLPTRRKLGDVGGTATLGKACALGKVGTIGESFDVSRNLSRVSGAISVKHDNDVAGGGSKTMLESIALAATTLVNNTNVGAKALGDFDGVVGAETIDQNHFVEVKGVKLGEDVGKVLGLIQRRNDDADQWRRNNLEMTVGNAWFGGGEVNNNFIRRQIFRRL